MSDDHLGGSSIQSQIAMNMAKGSSAGGLPATEAGLTASVVQGNLDQATQMVSREMPNLASASLDEVFSKEAALSSNLLDVADGSIFSQGNLKTDPKTWTTSFIGDISVDNATAGKGGGALGLPQGGMGAPTGMSSGGASH